MEGSIWCVWSQYSAFCHVFECH